MKLRGSVFLVDFGWFRVWDLNLVPDGIGDAMYGAGIGFRISSV